jgi:hypothetical protein
MEGAPGVAVFLLFTPRGFISPAKTHRLVYGIGHM